MQAQTTAENIGKFGQTSDKDVTLFSTYGFLQFGPPPAGSNYANNYVDLALSYLPEQFKSQPWNKLQ